MVVRSSGRRAGKQWRGARNLINNFALTASPGLAIRNSLRTLCVAVLVASALGLGLGWSAMDLCAKSIVFLDGLLERVGMLVCAIERVCVCVGLLACGMSRFLGACYPHCIVIVVISNVICLGRRMEVDSESMAGAGTEATT